MARRLFAVLYPIVYVYVCPTPVHLYIVYCTRLAALEDLHCLHSEEEGYKKACADVGSMRLFQEGGWNITATVM